MRNQRFVPQFEVTFPYYQFPQKANELYERVRFTGFKSKRQYNTRRYRDAMQWKKSGINFVDSETIKPFIK